MKRLTIKVTVGDQLLHWVVQWSPETGEHDFVFRPDVLEPMLHNELARLIKEEKATIEECRKATEASRTTAKRFIDEVVDAGLCDNRNRTDAIAEAFVSRTLVDGLCRLAVKEVTSKGYK